MEFHNQYFIRDDPLQMEHIKRKVELTVLVYEHMTSVSLFCFVLAIAVLPSLTAHKLQMETEALEIDLSLVLESATITKNI